MEEKQTEHNAACGEDKHSEHLCFLQYEGYHYQNRAEYKALVQDAAYICQNCGRTARSATNLCEPKEL
jgi:hypothetical protein